MLHQRIAPHAADWPAGHVVAKDFEIVALAGRGSFSTVYEAVQLSRQRRRVALKVLHAGIQHELERRADGVIENPYLREQALIQRLSSPVVCRVHRVGLHEGRYFAAIEWADGHTLDRVIADKKGHVRLTFAADVIHQLGEALAEMHRNQVVHRDLKPSNVMVSERRGQVAVRLFDFGIAKLAGEADGLVGSGTLLVGTPAYMAPEQANQRVTDPRSDIFSFAAVSYELLTGQRHIQSPGAARGADIFLDYLKTDAPIPTHPATTLRPDLPEDVDDVLASALSRDRHRRPSTVERFCDDLEIVLRAAAPPARRRGFLGRALGALRPAPKELPKLPPPGS
ncbi:MAG: serine/threonine protein kinase [Myxococcales bacterium]|nr:serine/threonine protein kinase [Myxococcales bacterium]